MSRFRKLSCDLTPCRGDRLGENHSDPPVPVRGGHRETGGRCHHPAPTSRCHLPGSEGRRGEEDSARQAGMHPHQSNVYLTGNSTVMMSTSIANPSHGSKLEDVLYIPADCSSCLLTRIISIYSCLVRTVEIHWQQLCFYQSIIRAHLQWSKVFLVTMQWSLLLFCFYNFFCPCNCEFDMDKLTYYPSHVVLYSTVKCHHSWPRHLTTALVERFPSMKFQNDSRLRINPNVVILCQTNTWPFWVS